MAAAANGADENGIVEPSPARKVNNRRKDAQAKQDRNLMKKLQRIVNKYPRRPIRRLAVDMVVDEWTIRRYIKLQELQDA